MDKTELDKFENDIDQFAARYSADRLKIITPNFDRDYRRAPDGRLHLVSEKAIIRVLGKVRKIPIGEDEQFKNYEEAFEATKKYWQEYYREVRANRSEAQRAAELKRQARYRERRKAKAQEIDQRQ